MDTVLQHHPVAHNMEAEAGPAHSGSSVKAPSHAHLRSFVAQANREQLGNGVAGDVHEPLRLFDRLVAVVVCIRASGSPGAFGRASLGRARS
jgi:hypothetical protein